MDRDNQNRLGINYTVRIIKKQIIKIKPTLYYLQKIK